MKYVSSFICAKCKQVKPVDGRMSYKITKRDSMNRPVYSKQCRDCAKESLLGKGEKA
jgi:hypothetical protein